MANPRIVVVSAGLSTPSSTALLAQQLQEATEYALALGNVQPDFTVIELRRLTRAIGDHFLTGFPTGELVGALDAVRNADAIIAVTPTFKASYTGIFKSFWDLVDDDAVRGKPVLMAATGGTSRHSLMIDTAMRPLFSYLGARILPTGVFAATDDFGTDVSLEARIERAGRELAAEFVLPQEHLPQAEPVVETYKAPGLAGFSVTPFEELLRR